MNNFSVGCWENNDQIPNRLSAYKQNGEEIWTNPNIEPPFNWVIIDDDETMVITGNNDTWTGYNIINGDMIFNVSIKDIKTRSDDIYFRCYYSAGPFANRHPIIMPNGLLAILCSNGKGNALSFEIKLIDIKTGKLNNKLLIFDQIPRIDIFIADNTNFYGIGYTEDLIIGVQKLSMS